MYEVCEGIKLALERAKNKTYNEIKLELLNYENKVEHRYSPN